MAVRHRVWTKAVALSLIPLLLMSVSLVVTLLPPSVAGGVGRSSLTLTPSADASIRSWQPTATLGAEQTLDVSYAEIDAPTGSFTLIRFDLDNALPSDAIIDSATLELL